VVVPVGATAEVHVPGEAEPVEVRHGTHTWRVPDRWAQSGGLPAAPTVRDVLDDEETWRQVVAAATELEIVRGEAHAAERLEAWLDEPSAAIVDALVPPGLANGAAALRERLSPVLVT